MIEYSQHSKRIRKKPILIVAIKKRLKIEQKITRIRFIRKSLNRYRISWKKKQTKTFVLFVWISREKDFIQLVGTIFCALKRNAYNKSEENVLLVWQNVEDIRESINLDQGLRKIINIL